MTERIPLKGGAEHGALSGWRRVFKFRPGERKKAKRSYARRLRKWLKGERDDD